MTTKAEIERMEADLAAALAAKEELEAQIAERDAAAPAATSTGLPDRFADLDGEAEVSVVTTAPGAWGLKGVLPVGTPLDIKTRHFSRSWMKPADAKSAALTNAWTKAMDLTREDRANAEVRRRNAMANLIG